MKTIALNNTGALVRWCKEYIWMPPQRKLGSKTGHQWTIRYCNFRSFPYSTSQFMPLGRPGLLLSWPRRALLEAARLSMGEQKKWGAAAWARFKGWGKWWHPVNSSESELPEPLARSCWAVIRINSRFGRHCGYQWQWHQLERVGLLQGFSQHVSAPYEAWNGLKMCTLTGRRCQERSSLKPLKLKSVDEQRLLQRSSSGRYIMLRDGGCAAVWSTRQGLPLQKFSVANNRGDIAKSKGSSQYPQTGSYFRRFIHLSISTMCWMRCWGSGLELGAMDIHIPSYGVSSIGVPPNHPWKMGFSRIHPFWGSPIDTYWHPAAWDSVVERAPPDMVCKDRCRV